jgi:hypothetical protein
VAASVIALVQTSACDSDESTPGAAAGAAGRGILADASVACLASAAHNQWNRYEIRAEGGTLVHHVNDVECIRFEEDSTDAASEGVIALQYHIPGAFEVRFRALRLTELRR